MNYDPIRNVYIDPETGDIIPAAEGDDVGDVELYTTGEDRLPPSFPAPARGSNSVNTKSRVGSGSKQVSQPQEGGADEDEDLRLAMALQEEEQHRAGVDGPSDYATLMHDPSQRAPGRLRSGHSRGQGHEGEATGVTFFGTLSQAFGGVGVGRGRAALTKQMQQLARSRKKDKADRAIPEQSPDAVVERLAVGDGAGCGGGGVAGLRAPSGEGIGLDMVSLGDEDGAERQGQAGHSSLYREALEAEARATADDWSIARAMQMAEMEIDNELYQREGGDFRDKEVRGSQCCRQLKTVSTLLCVLQILFLVVMVEDDGYAPEGENPMIGPPATTMVRYGAKYAAMIKYDHEWWRLLSPIMLHAGVIHLISNVVIQLRIGGYLNLVFGWKRWLAIYVGSGVFGNMLSCIFLTDSVGVGSSGAVLGMLTSWLLWIVFRWKKIPEACRGQRNCQLVLVIGAVAFTLAMSFSSMVDWAAHFGGAIMGVLLGAFFLAKELDNDSTKLGMKMIGGGLALGLFVAALVWMLVYMRPTRELLEYFEDNDDWKHFPHRDND